tara:strand:+ start:636 stop:1208 length:573 start_codon:yes stop_codon:yes gene_type:complete
MWNIVKNKCESFYYVESTRFLDFTTQVGGTLDVLVPILLGVGGTDPEGLITGSGSVITVNKTGPFMVKQNFQVSRESNPGNTEFFFQAQASVDNGITWVALGNSANRRITNTSTIDIFFDISPIFALAGTKFRNVFAKSSVGGDPNNPTTGVAEGVLLHARPSSALIAEGVQDSPSAIAVVYKVQGYNYI